jgi:hypothetical protein
MIRIKRRNFILLAIVAFLIERPIWGLPFEIQPLHTTAVFSKSSSAPSWRAYVLAPDGRRVYRLSLEPEYGPKNQVIGLNLLLSPAQTKSQNVNSNLLNPHNWHGLQPYEFLGKDLAKGADKSVFGAHRELKIEDKKLVIRMDVSKSMVSPLANGDYEIDQLELAIAIENLP